MGLGFFHTRRSRGIAVATAAIVAVTPVGLTACGDGDDGAVQGRTDATVSTEVDSRDASAASPTRPRSTRARPGLARGGPALAGNPAEARRAVESVDGVYRDFGEAVASGVAAIDVPARQTLEEAADNEALARVCALMSKQAKRQTIAYARRSAGLADVKWNCENATGLLLRRARQTGGLKRALRAEVVGVNVDGDRATASVRFGGKGPISTLPMVREDGRWKLGVAPSGGGG